MAYGRTVKEPWTADEAFWDKPLLSPRMDSALTGLMLGAFLIFVLAIYFLGGDLMSNLHGLFQQFVHDLNHALNGGGGPPKPVVYR